MRNSTMEDDFRKALEKWLSENPGKTINDIPSSTVVTLSPGEEIWLGKKISNLRSLLKGNNNRKISEEQKEYWIEKYGLSVENQKRKIKEKNELKYRKALEKWLSENPDKTVNDVPISTIITLETGEEIKLGGKINNLRAALKGQGTNKISESQKSYWIEKHGLGPSNNQKTLNDENELKYREALEKWLNENPGKTVNDVQIATIVTLSTGEQIRLGKKINHLRTTLKGKGTSKIVESQRNYWVEKQDLSIENQLDKLKEENELKYREALEKWLSDNPNKTVNDVTQSTVVTIGSNEEIKLGVRVNNIRQALRGKGNHKISTQQKEYWVEKQGLIIEKLNEEKELKAREALEKWLSDNPKKTVNDITMAEIVIISTGEQIKLGNKIHNLRQALKGQDMHKISKFQKEYWVEKYGLSSENQKENINEENELKYREALEKWLSDNPGKTVNDVQIATIVTLSTKEEIRLGNKISTLRRALNGNGNFKISTSQRKYWVEKHGLSFENQLEKQNKENELKYQEALEKWLRENPGKTVNDIPQRTTVTLITGEEINLGIRITSLRNALKEQRGYKISESQRAYWVEKYGLSAENKLEKKEQEKELKYREALEIWLSENKEKTINDVPSVATVTLKTNEKINLGRKITYFRQALKGQGNSKISESQRKYWVEKHGLTPQKEQTSDKTTTLEKYIEQFNGDEEKAKRVLQTLKNIREKRKSKKKEEWNIDNILAEFDVDIEKLMSYLNKTRKEKIKKDKTLEYQGKTLKEFCIENSFNYDVISRAVRLHEIGIHGNLEELINRELVNYQKHGQKEAATWIYEKYGNLVKHVLLYLNLDSSSIIKEMSSYQITLEEAIRHEVFKHAKEKQENNWLEELYEYLIDEVQQDKSKEQTTDDIANMFAILVKEYHLTKEEMNILWNSFSKYIKTIKQYQLVDVGLETNEERKLEKIKDYKLEPEDIEESFFIPLEFDKKVLLGRKSELYQRRQLLRQYIIDWDYYTELEKQEIIIKNNFTEEEISKIEKTRTKINETIDLVEERRL